MGFYQEIKRKKGGDLPHAIKIGQTHCMELVKYKDVYQLQNLGGVHGVASAIGSNVENGIDDDAEDIAQRREAFGSNTFKKPLAKSFFHFMVGATTDFTIVVLIVCAVLSLGLGIKQHGLKQGWYEGGCIFFAVFLLVSFVALTNLQQERQFNKLSRVTNRTQVNVVRGGRHQKISISDIVVGDVVCLATGDQIPAEGLFLRGYSLLVDESSITGESAFIDVNCSENPFLFSGTKVVDGYAQMLVTSVGMNTSWVESWSSTTPDCCEQTPLQTQLNKLTSLISKVGLAVAFVVFIVMLVYYFTGNTKDENGNREFNGSKTKVDDKVNSVLRIVAAAITIIVVAIPEGLPLAITLSLAYSVKKMMADQVLVRKLSACETMGAATTICADKTGTLTLNKMKVTKFWQDQDFVKVGAYSSIAPSVLDLIRQGVALNTTGRVDRSTSVSEFEFSGSPTETAILSWAVRELKMEMTESRQSCNIIHHEAFNSQKKRSGVLMKNKTDNTIHVHWKGAAEIILAMCSSYYDASGMIRDLNDDERIRFEQIIEGMAACSLRCIAFAHKQIAEEERADENNDNILKEDCLTLLGLVGLKDPCRPGMLKSVQACQNAGLNIKMITGDNLFTAKAIAFECGILQPVQDMSPDAVIEGAEFRNYTPEERKQKVDRIRVMARSSPSDKLLMVECLRQKGHVVAVTGNGINDAPALLEADIGISMGIQGCEVAKESSDIIILDDNFASIVQILRWGRCIYDNIRKFIQFQLTVNIAALVINFVVSVSVGEVPLTVVQLLWVNLIMDTLGALALATEQPTMELREKAPTGRTDPLITNVMWRNLSAQTLYQIAVLLTLQFKGESMSIIKKEVKNTMMFNTFVLCQLFNGFNARDLEKKNVFKGIRGNKLFWGIIGITILLQVVMVELLKRFAGTERLDLLQWGVCVALASISWAIGCLVKFIPVPKKPIL